MCLMSFNVVWCCSILLDGFWCCLILLDVVWCCSVLYGVIWCCLMLFGLIWYCLMLFYVICSLKILKISQAIWIALNRNCGWLLVCVWLPASPCLFWNTCLKPFQTSTWDCWFRWFIFQNSPEQPSATLPF